MIIWAIFFVLIIINIFIYNKPTIIWLNVPLLLNSTFMLSIILSLQVQMAPNRLWSHVLQFKTWEVILKRRDSTRESMILLYRIWIPNFGIRYFLDDHHWLSLDYRMDKPKCRFGILTILTLNFCAKSAASSILISIINHDDFAKQSLSLILSELDNDGHDAICFREFHR